MTNLPLLTAGATIVAEDRWRDHLWAAVPHRVIRSTADELITYTSTGAIATRASSRGLPEAEGLTRDERKMYSLRTCHAHVAEVPEAPDKLFFYRRDRWSRISLGWDHSSGTFGGWYVNFELPAAATPTGLATTDLALDLWVNPDRTWDWKDRTEYETLMAEGILDMSIDGHLQAEAVRVVEEISNRTGPFADQWGDFAPDDDSVPMLPPEFAWGGSAWRLPGGPRLAA